MFILREPCDQDCFATCNMQYDLLFHTAGQISAEDKERQQRYAMEKVEKDAKLQNVCEQGFQSCIVGYPTAEPKALFQAVLPLLAPSACFAVFFPVLQPLAECMNELIVSSKTPTHLPCYFYMQQVSLP